MKKGPSLRLLEFTLILILATALFTACLSPSTRKSMWNAWAASSTLGLALAAFGEWDLARSRKRYAEASKRLDEVLKTLENFKWNEEPDNAKETATKES